ncbi:2-hydroxyacid dehydrogenase [Terrihabitans sp. B22-R8]|uniref:2-hydroxyacid dehydrogenase n=1 Tax=Terrihabitans sp. B22-R8 TaxID=3425128 RepID=UPI00403D3676
MSKPDLLMINRVRDFVEGALTGHFNVHRLWELDEAALSELAPRVRALAGFGGKVDRAFMERLPELAIISTSSVGYDGIDAPAAAERGVVVTNTPDVLTEEVADLTLGLLLATVRDIPRAERHLREGHWPSGPFRLTATLRGRTVGIIGLGRIGKAIAKRCEGFDLPIAYHGRRRQADVDYTYFESSIEMARSVDILISVMPGGAATQHMVGEEIFEALGPNGIFINVGRGSCVDEKALITALQNGTILAAGLDVFEHEPNVPDALLALDNTVLLPHVASASTATRDAMAQLMVDNLIAWAEGRAPETPVPETPWPPQR